MAHFLSEFISFAVKLRSRGVGTGSLWPFRLTQAYGNSTFLKIYDITHIFSEREYVVVRPSVVCL